MRLTVFTDFALRVLIYLALDPERKVTIRDISDGYGISRNHLMKIVNNLTRAGLIETSRGVRGGLMLARDPCDITVGEVLRIAEDDFALVECFRPDNQCRITPACSLKKMLGEAADAFLDVLDGYTVQDLVVNREPLRELLSIASEQ